MKNVIYCIQLYSKRFNHIEDLTNNPKLLQILQYYKNYRSEIADENSELYKLKKEYDELRKS